MKKTILPIIMTTILLSGCGVEPDKSRFVYDQSNKSDDVSTYIFKDTKTGCKYVLFDWYNGGGASPLLDENGKPVCEKQQ